jgi:hypothetical protein
VWQGLLCAPLTKSPTPPSQAASTAPVPDRRAAPATKTHGWPGAAQRAAEGHGPRGCAGWRGRLQRSGVCVRASSGPVPSEAAGWLLAGEAINRLPPQPGHEAASHAMLQCNRSCCHLTLSGDAAEGSSGCGPSSDSSLLALVDLGEQALVHRLGHVLDRLNQAADHLRTHTVDVRGDTHAATSCVKADASCLHGVYKSCVCIARRRRRSSAAYAWPRCRH